ncbi:hypothetical protein BYI23_D011920 (plasmid) [Burkholderia sp. YI23]|nr:hypothetical protein BYI23_D011920 [Burkholderia sp. YI23]
MLAVSALAACAPAIQVQKSQLTASNTSQPFVRIVTPVVIRLSTGYSRQLNAGSMWRPVGVLPQGVVYRPVNSEFTIEGRQVHEAYLVLNANVLVGFFLPGESNFSALDPSQSIQIEKVNG